VTYKVSAPIMTFYPGGRELDLERALHELRRTRSERVFLIAPGIYNQENLAAKMPRLSACLDFFAKAGLETGVWIAQTIGHGGVFHKANTRFPPIINLHGNPENAICPLDEAFKRVVCDGVREIARAGAQVILIDDDFRMGERSGTVGCFCERHLEAFRARTGLRVTREEVAEKAFTGPPSQFRDAWLDLTGDSLAQMAREMRQAVDGVDPKIRLGLCACTSSWDIDGISSDELSRIMAGKTRPLLRLIGAPYWTNHGQRLAPIIELERLQRSWIEGDIEVIAEGDTWPRPRHHTPAAILEGFDTALRADGRLDGILKYMFDYVSSFDYETKYADLTERNQPLYTDIERIFAGRTAVGANVARKMNNLRKADLPEKADSGFLYQNFFHSSAIRFLTDNAVPIACQNENCPVIVFGQDARSVARESFRNGGILDAVAARILSDQGIDVGLQSMTPAHGASWESFVTDNEVVQIQGSRYAMTVHAEAQVLSRLMTDDAGEIPGAYLYENAAGERFLVYAFDACESQNDRGVFRSYCRQRQLIDAIAWLARRPLDAVCPGHPDLYILVKKNEDGLAIGLWNFFADAIESPRIFLADDYADADIINSGDAGFTLANRQLTLHGNIAPYGFAGILLRQKR
jgi:hypothetical protein